MTRGQRNRMSDREKAVWGATYAAAWHHDFRGFEAAHGFNHLLVDPESAGLTMWSHAERACDVADLAVEDMRRWEGEEVGRDG